VRVSTVLAIDQGTSGTKAIVVDPAEGIVAIAEAPVRPRYLPGGGVEQDPDELLESVLDTGRRAIAAAARPIDAVALANQGETVLAWDRATGRPLSEAIGWQDRRSATVVAPLIAASEWVHQRTGLVLDPYFSAPKMAWLRRNRTTAGVVTTSDTWLLHQLTDEFVTDVSTASRSLLTDLDTVEWDADLLALFGLQDEELPSIVACDTMIGATQAFGPELAVAGLIVDQQAALLAQGCTSAGSGKCTFGTGAFLLANTGERALRSQFGLSSSVAWQLGGVTKYCLDGQVFTAASAVRWLVDVGLIASAEDIDRLDGDPADGVLCVPALAGLGAPWWRADASASFVGVTLSTSREQLVLAVVHGIAAQVAELAGLVKSDVGLPIERLRVDGGLVQCRALMQATADLLQIPIDVYPYIHATALGAAATAQLAIVPGNEDLLPSWTPAQSYEPRWPKARADDYLQRWRAALKANLVPERT
jgi:glycerol kinase